MVLATVSITCPAAVKICPYHVYGSSLAQTVVSIVVVSSGATLKLSVRIVSQPEVLETVSIICPAAVNMCPYHVYGSSLAQTVVSIVVVSSGATPRFNVLMVSQPVELATVSITCPAAVKI